MIPGIGTVYFGAYRSSGDWGTLEAEKGVLVASDGGSRRVSALVRRDDATVAGDGWTFKRHRDGSFAKELGGATTKLFGRSRDASCGSVWSHHAQRSRDQLRFGALLPSRGCAASAPFGGESGDSYDYRRLLKLTLEELCVIEDHLGQLD